MTDKSTFTEDELRLLLTKMDGNIYNVLNLLQQLYGPTEQYIQSIKTLIKVEQENE